MSELLQAYAPITGEDVIHHLRQLAGPLAGMRVVHVNSTRAGGGVAEILYKLVPLQRELGMDASWEVIDGGEDFFRCTKSIHNALQGYQVEIPDKLVDTYMATNAENAERLRGLLEDADMVFIHDPQPAALISHCPNRRGKWIWRCHPNVSRPYRPVWRLLHPIVAEYDASIFSLAEFSQALPHPEYLVPPSIDPLSEKNRELPPGDIDDIREQFGLDPERPLLVQVSRYDWFKDPVGVIRAYRLAKRFVPGLQLTLAGGGASDDPEADAVLVEVHRAAGEDPDIHVLELPPDAHHTINALQRAADIVLQKSTKEGFGLTVTEGMWKGKPVIGGNTGGIKLQVVNHHTGYLVESPEGAALRVRQLLHSRDKLMEMGLKAREFVRENFLLTRQLRENLTLMVSLAKGSQGRIELS